MCVGGWGEMQEPLGCGVMRKLCIFFHNRLSLERGLLSVYIQSSNIQNVLFRLYGKLLDELSP